MCESDFLRRPRWDRTTTSTTTRLAKTRRGEGSRARHPQFLLPTWLRKSSTREHRTEWWGLAHHNTPRSIAAVVRDLCRIEGSCEVRGVVASYLVSKSRWRAFSLIARANRGPISPNLRQSAPPRSWKLMVEVRGNPDSKLRFLVQYGWSRAKFF